MRRPPNWSIAIVGFVVAVVGIGYGVHRWQGPAQASAVRPPGIPSAVSTGLADLMGLSPLPSRAAPDFTLVDQHGKMMSLSGFRGRSVVLEFMDPHCTDICPIISREFVQAFKDLGPKAAGAVFIAVNVNAFHNTPGDMLAYSKEQGLDSIPNWHFLTGQVPNLQSVWHNYGIYVDAPTPDADVIHSSIVYFIDSRGVERFSAAPMDDHTSDGRAYLPVAELNAWGQGIALVAKQIS